MIRSCRPRVTGCGLSQADTETATPAGTPIFTFFLLAEKGTSRIGETAIVGAFSMLSVVYGLGFMNNSGSLEIAYGRESARIAVRVNQVQSIRADVV